MARPSLVPSYRGLPAPVARYRPAGRATVAATLSGTLTRTASGPGAVPDRLRHETLTGPRSVHSVPLAEASPAAGGSIWTVAAPTPVTVTPSRPRVIGNNPPEPQPCEKLSVPFWLIPVPTQDEVVSPTPPPGAEQPGSHCSHIDVPPSARIFAGPSAAVSVSSVTRAAGWPVSTRASSSCHRSIGPCCMPAEAM